MKAQPRMKRPKKPKQLRPASDPNASQRRSCPERLAHLCFVHHIQICGPCLSLSPPNMSAPAQIAFRYRSGGGARTTVLQSRSAAVFRFCPHCLTRRAVQSFQMLAHLRSSAHTPGHSPSPPSNVSLSFSCCPALILRYTPCLGRLHAQRSRLQDREDGRITTRRTRKTPSRTARAARPQD